MGTLDDQELLLEDSLLLQNEHSDLITGDGIRKSKTGNWKACLFILGNETCERLAYFGIITNLVTYLTTRLHEGNVSAARIVSIWSGTCYLTPLIGAFLADAYWGRYWTIAVFSMIHFLGMSTLTLSASLPVFTSAGCDGAICASTSTIQYAVLYVGLYLVSLGTGGIKPCISSFGADQFDETDSNERIDKASFFNWFYFSITLGSLVSSTLVVWVQENVGWGIGFGIPTLFMGFSMVLFFCGTPLYRFQRPGGSPLTRICQVVVASVSKFRLEVPQDSSLLYETSDAYSAIQGSRKLEHTENIKFLDKAAIVSEAESRSGNFSNRWRLCCVTQVEELKILIGMFPIWATGIVYSAVFDQMNTMFVEQGMVMKRTIGSFTIPAASLSTCEVISALLWTVVYDKILVIIAKMFTGKERGISILQRIGIGYFISMLSMVCAAVLETRRLMLAENLGLIDKNVAIPVNILWQLPQYFLLGMADVFAYVGKLEFFYQQAPDAMRSSCTAYALLITAGGKYLSSLVLTIVAAITTVGGKPGWIPDNLNEGQLHNYFWLWAGLSFLNLLVFVNVAMRYNNRTQV